jgi:phosphotransferase system HPr (HPr) family protein
MKLERPMIVRDSIGLHARPAALFVKEAVKFQATIGLRFGDKEANAKSILEVLSLDASQGAVLAVWAEGDDADEALDSLQALLEAATPSSGAPR